MPTPPVGTALARAATRFSTTQFLQANRAEQLHGILACVADGHATGRDILAALGTGRYDPPAPYRRLTTLRQVDYHTTALLQLGWVRRPATRGGQWAITRAGRDWRATALGSSAWRQGLATACALHPVFARTLAFVAAHPRRGRATVAEEIDQWYLAAEGVMVTDGGAGPRRGGSILRLLLSAGLLTCAPGTHHLRRPATHPGIVPATPPRRPVAAPHAPTPAPSPVLVPLAEVPTGVMTGVSTRRLGQGRLSKATRLAYGGCAVCDERDAANLVCSHVARWADDVASRGRMDNVICLCKTHDLGFEEGTWSLDARYRVVHTTAPISTTRRRNLPARDAFRRPAHHPPHPTFLAEHRRRVGLAA